jgi:hypothetical protein
MAAKASLWRTLNVAVRVFEIDQDKSLDVKRTNAVVRREKIGGEWRHVYYGRCPTALVLECEGRPTRVVSIDDLVATIFAAGDPT